MYLKELDSPVKPGNDEKAGMTKNPLTRHSPVPHLVRDRGIQAQQRPSAVYE